MTYRVGMARTHIVTPAVKRKIEVLLSKGKTIADVANRLGMSYCGVYYWAKEPFREEHQKNMLSHYYMKKAAERKAAREAKKKANSPKPLPEISGGVKVGKGKKKEKEKGKRKGC